MAQQTPFELQYSRDIRMFWSHNQASLLEASLIGRVIRRNSKGGIIFFSLYDPSGVIECKADKSNFSVEIWDTEIRAIRRGDRISVRGPVETQIFRGHAQPILDIYQAQRILAGDTQQIDDIVGSLSVITSGFFMARLKRRVAGDLIDRKFEEFEPRYIRNSKPQGPLEPLQVIYPGYGSPAYLLVSPVRDLRSVSLITGVPKVFSVVRVFSQTIRDGYTSAESLVIGLVIMGDEAEQLVDLCVELVYGCFGDYTTMANNWGVFSTISSWAHDTLPAFGTALPSLSVPTILQLDHLAFALAWPGPSSADAEPQEPLLVAEGNVRSNELGIKEGTAIIHIERMARAIRDDLTLRT